MNSKPQTKCVLAVALLGAMIFIQSVALSQSESEQPNIVIILSDDHGSVDLNCYGAKDLWTPNIDQLAKSGVKFNNFYVASPLCSPSRAALLTGLTPQAAGLPNNASSKKGVAGMPGNRTTIAETFKKAGYSTGHIGKWHIGFTPETMPNGQGFDYSYGHMGGCIDNYSHFFYWNGPNRHDLYENGTETWEDGRYFPDLMADQADKFIIDHKNNPFFLYYAINLPHYPVQPTAKWRAHYKDLPSPRAGYAAFVSTIDERVGRLMVTLDSLQLRENTIVIFQSDHGHSVEQRNFGGGGSAGPYRGAKSSLFEGGIKVPAIISYPKEIDSNEERNQVATNMDWYPTLVDYAGLEIPEVEGKSLKKVIDRLDEQTPHPILKWKYGVSWAIRKNDWKLIGFPYDPVDPSSLDPDTDQLFLSNLKVDSTERINLAHQYPDKVQELVNDYMTWEYADEDDRPQDREKFTTLALGSGISLTNLPHKKYAGSGSQTLIDGKLGSRQYTDQRWLGFEGNDMTAVLDLGSSQKIEAVIIGTLQNAEAWIFLPEYIEVSWSSDGRNYNNPVMLELKELKDMGRKTIQRTEFRKENIEARYVKVMVKNVGKCPDWHSASGQKAWMFLDEITVQ